MKNLVLILSLLISAASFGQAPGTNAYPPYGPPPANDITFRPLTLQTISTPDVAGGTDTIKLNPYAYQVNVQPSDSLADSIVYCIPNKIPVSYNTSTTSSINYQTGLLYSELNFYIQCNNAATKTKVKFRNKYNSAFLFSTAGDSTISLTSKQRLFIQFRNIDGIHYQETGKYIK